MSVHAPTITITILLAAAPATPAGFGVPTLLVDEAQGTGNGLGGARYLEFTSTDDAQTARDAAQISAEVLAAATAAFSPTKKIGTFRVCRVDTGGGETYSDALSALEDAGPNGGIWLLLMDSRTAATQVALGATVNAKPYFLVIQSSDTDWLSAGWPAAYSSVEDFERMAGVFHDTDSEWADVEWACNRIAFDPDNPAEGSVQWECKLTAAAAYTTKLTPSQGAAAKAHPIAVIDEYGGASKFLDPGHSFANRAIYEQFSADWYAAGARTRLEALVVQQSDRGRKIILNPTGQAMVRAVLEELNNLATAGRHLVEGQVVVDTPPLTSADLDARRIPVTMTGQIAGSARLIDLNIYFTREQVVVPT